jgi:hypothetical protein
MRTRRDRTQVHRLIGLLPAMLVLAAATPQVAAAERLSDEFKVTRVAHVYVPAKIRKAPERSAKMLARLRLETEDGLPEIYLVLSSRKVRSHTWLQIRIPGRPNGRTGWVEREALGPLITRRTHLRINRKTLKATLYKRGRVIWSSPIGVGAAGTETPAGRFWIRERLRSLGGAYGPWAFGTAAYSKLSDWPGGGVIGIHGTNQPNLIPGRPSHGCIRVPNHKVEQLAKLMPIGTSVQIL